MSTRVEVLLWAGRVIARKGGAPHELLEIPAEATLDQAQEAFHKLAKIAHPDLHRTTLDAAELEKVTTAYAYVAAAYQEMRVAKVRGRTGAATEKPTDKQSGDLPRVKRQSEPARTVVLPGGGIVRGATATRAPATKTGAPPGTTAPPPSRTTSRTIAAPGNRSTGAPPAEPPPPMPADPATLTPSNPSTAMNSKALIYYRKAEMALRQGDLRMAVLNLKMGIAADPQSTFLRKAIAEVEAELKAK